LWCHETGIAVPDALKKLLRVGILVVLLTRYQLEHQHRTQLANARRTDLVLVEAVEYRVHAVFGGGLDDVQEGGVPGVNLK
jgi:hypothetical protein